MPTLKELSAEYDELRTQVEKEKSAVEELKPKLTTLNHIKYNFDILARDSLPDSLDLSRDTAEGR